MIRSCLARGRSCLHIAIITGNVNGTTHKYNVTLKTMEIYVYHIVFYNLRYEVWVLSLYIILKKQLFMLVGDVFFF